MTGAQLYNFMMATVFLVVLIISSSLYPLAAGGSVIYVGILLSAGLFLLVNLYSALKPFVKQESEDKANTGGKGDVKY
ncbi:hypothetical protein [Vibrio alginolyticus]|uniref:hypothetical protein n=1 Tax=Vibrio alginolyticus TaxID=663 RepID=UPI00215D14B5|nr:hypothetical protein [Vibrio alginolyticus]MCR9514102.1 hypothetical protein [Vibrio alginolyticus]